MALNIPQPLATGAIAAFAGQFAVNKPIAPPVLTDAQRAIAEEKKTATDLVKQSATDLGTNSPNSKVHFIFNAQ